MSIHEPLPAQARRELKEVGWTEGLELAKLARSEGQRLDCAIGLHKARSLAKEEFKREVEKELTGRENRALGDYLALSRNLNSYSINGSLRGRDFSLRSAG